MPRYRRCTETKTKGKWSWPCIRSLILLALVSISQCHLAYGIPIYEEFDFYMSINPSSGEVVRGTSGSTTVEITWNGNEPKATVSLTIWDKPSGVDVSLNPISGKPDFTSRMDIFVSQSAPAGGPQTITITGSGGGKTHSASYTLFVKEPPPKYPITFTQTGIGSSASGTVLVVEGVSYGYSSLPITFDWEVQSSHSFAWSSSVSGGTGINYIWTSTSGLSTAQSGSISVPTGGGSVTASFKTQYRLNMQVNPLGGGTTVPTVGTHWYDSGTQITIQTSPASGYVFRWWNGIGTGSYSGETNPATTLMNGPITETANFETPPPPLDFDFSVSVDPSSLSVVQGGSIDATVRVALVKYPETIPTVSLTASWIPSGVSVSFDPFSGTPPFSSRIHVAVSTSTLTWTYVMAISGTGSGVTRTATCALEVKKPTGKQSVATFSHLGLGPSASGTVLSVDGVSYKFSSLPITFYWEVGSSHSFAWPILVSGGEGIRYAWTSTSGLSITQSGLIIAPSDGGNIKASFETQYQLTMRVTPLGAGTTDPTAGTYWYDSGAKVTIQASPAPGYEFREWIGAGDMSYTGPSSLTTVVMSGPITQTANFTRSLFEFSISVDPSSANVVQGGSVSITIAVDLVSGTTNPVILSVSHLPMSTEYSFKESFDLAPFTTTLTISTLSDTPAGTYTITVTGVGGGKIHSTKFTLSVIQTRTRRTPPYDDAWWTAVPGDMAGFSAYAYQSAYVGDPEDYFLSPANPATGRMWLLVQAEATGLPVARATSTARGYVSFTSGPAPSNGWATVTAKVVFDGKIEALALLKLKVGTGLVGEIVGIDIPPGLLGIPTPIYTAECKWEMKVHIRVEDQTTNTVVSPPGLFDHITGRIEGEMDPPEEIPVVGEKDFSVSFWCIEGHRYRVDIGIWIGTAVRAETIFIPYITFSPGYARVYWNQNAFVRYVDVEWPWP